MTRLKPPRGWLRLPALTVWSVSFALIVYLALAGGAYDPIIRGQTGIVAWWVVLLLALAGGAAVVRLERRAWIAIGLLVAFAVWTGLASGWSESAERTLAELGRVAALLGIFVLGLLAIRAASPAPLINGLACGMGVVAFLAVMSRLHPGWFPDDEVQRFFPGGTRLNYPLNYASGTGNFLAIGVALLLGAATRARSVAGQALAVAALPIVVLAVALTASRGAVLTGAVGLVVFFLLTGDRIPKVLTAAVASGGAVVLVLALLDRPALREGLRDAAAIEQASQIEVLMALVCGAVAALQVGLALVVRLRDHRDWLRIPPRPARGVFAIACVTAVVAALATGLPGTVSNQWQEFKEPNVAGAVAGNTLSRLGTVTGSHRYQYWQSANDALQTRAWTGRGPGTFEFWWARDNSVSEFVRDAHSLYLQTLAEAGIVGMALLGAFLLTLLGVGAARALQAPPDLRDRLATATACVAAFCAAAATDWIWQIAVVPVLALLLGSSLVASSATASMRDAGVPRRVAGRVALVALAVAGLVAVVVPYTTTSLLRESQANVRAGDLPAAIESAVSAARMQPSAASPRLQRALVLELAGDFRGGARAAAQATQRESTNWRTWLVRARIEARAGDRRSAVRSYRRARSLNPRSPIFAR